MIDATTEAEILRLFRMESWPIGTIARHLRLHHSAVERIVRKPTDLNARRVRPTIIEPFMPFITETLEQYPGLTSRRLYDMCLERGYVGAPDHFGATLRRLRPERERRPEAFLQLTTLIAEQAQVDWGSFGTISIGRAHRQLQAFTMVLSWSRMIFLRFFVGAAMPCFLRGHVEAFTFFGGVARCLLYDNLKSAVLARYGQAIRFNPTIIALARHYTFEPRPVAPRRGEHKGRVERGIRFVRDSFFAGRTWADLDDLNQQALEWCQGRAASRKWRDDRTRDVRNAFQEERPRLTPLPATPFACDDVTNVRIQKTPYAHFDSNQYSVPHRCVMKALTVAASETEVRLLDGLEVVAVHPRCYDKGQVIEKPEHLAELRAQKRRAEHGQASSVLFRAAPSALPLLQQIGERGQNLGAATNQLLKLLQRFGGTALEAAVAVALERGTPNPRSVRTILEVDQARRADEPAVPVELPDDPRVRGLVVQSHDLALYDQLHRSEEAAHGD
jgi:transposase